MDKLKVLIIGSKGLLGKEMVKQMEKDVDYEIITSDVSDEGGIDITSEESVKDYFEKHQPDVVINCAAFTNVDACETPEGFELAKKVNGYGPGILAKYCKDNDAIFIHFSSDYVFGDNKKDGYPEDYSNFKPLNKYAESKLLGEQEIIKVFDGTHNSPAGRSLGAGGQLTTHNPKAYILRTSWLFGAGATNFIAKIIKYAKEKDYLEVVTDEVSSPTYIKDLAERTIYIIKEKPEGGIYHVSGKGHCSRYDFAKEILKWAKIDTEVRPITWEKFAANRKTQIANYSYLLNTKLPPMRDWQEMVKDYVKNDYSG